MTHLHYVYIRPHERGGGNEGSELSDAASLDW